MKKLFLLLTLALTLTSCDDIGGFESSSELTSFKREYIEKHMLPVDSMATLQGVDVQVYTDPDWSLLAVTTPERYLIATTTSNSNLITPTTGQLIILTFLAFVLGLGLGGTIN